MISGKNIHKKYGTVEVLRGGKYCLKPCTLIRIHGYASFIMLILFLLLILWGRRKW